MTKSIPAILRTAALGVTLTCAAIAPALARQSAQTTETMPAALTAADRIFLTTMLQESRTQLALAQLAGKRATTQTEFGAAYDVATEWSELKGRLIALAVANGAPVRGTLDTAQHNELWRLGRTKSAGFDSAFLTDARRGNELALSTIGQENTTASPQIQQFLVDARLIISNKGDD
jgi:hypothetical protein